MTVTSFLFSVCAGLLLGACIRSTRGEPLSVEVIANSVSCGGSRLHYLEAGKPGAPPILLLHGARFSSETWRGLGTIERFAQAGFHVVALDLPGYGASPNCDAATDGGTYLSAALDALSLTRPVIVTPSMSGRFALPFAASAPARVAGLVAVAPVDVDANLEALVASKLKLLAIWGTEDSVISIDVGRRLAAETGAKLVELEGAPHPSYLQATPAFEKAVLDFARGVQGL